MRRLAPAAFLLLTNALVADSFTLVAESYGLPELNESSTSIHLAVGYFRRIESMTQDPKCHENNISCFYAPPVLVDFVVTRNLGDSSLPNQITAYSETRHQGIFQPRSGPAFPHLVQVATDGSNSIIPYFGYRDLAMDEAGNLALPLSGPTAISIIDCEYVFDPVPVSFVGPKDVYVLPRDAWEEGELLADSDYLRISEDSVRYTHGIYLDDIDRVLRTNGQLEHSADCN